jgi:hypothetical protein
VGGWRGRPGRRRVLEVAVLAGGAVLEVAVLAGGGEPGTML